jgi:hypothetical protein
MSNPRPESRIKSLEQRASDLEADIVELASDQAEEFKAIRLNMQQGFQQAHDFVQERFAETNERLNKIEATMATKDDIAELKGLMMQLLQQKGPES